MGVIRAAEIRDNIAAAAGARGQMLRRTNSNIRAAAGADCGVTRVDPTQGQRRNRGAAASFDRQAAGIGGQLQGASRRTVQGNMILRNGASLNLQRAARTDRQPLDRACRGHRDMHRFAMIAEHRSAIDLQDMAFDADSGVGDILIIPIQDRIIRFAAGKAHINAAGNLDPLIGGQGSGLRDLAADCGAGAAASHEDSGNSDFDNIAHDVPPAVIRR